MAKAQKSSTRPTSDETLSETLTIVISPLPANKRGRFDDPFTVSIDSQRSTWPEASGIAIKRKIIHAIQTAFDEQGYLHDRPVWLVINSKSHEISEALVTAVWDVALGERPEVNLLDDAIRVRLLSDLKKVDNQRVGPETERSQNPEFTKAIEAGKNAPRLGFDAAIQCLRQLHQSVERGSDRFKGVTVLQQVLSSLAECGDAGTLEQKRLISHQISDIREILRVSLAFTAKSGTQEAVSLTVSDQNKGGIYRCRATRGLKGRSLSGTKAFPRLELSLKPSSSNLDLADSPLLLGEFGTALRTEFVQKQLSEQDIRTASAQLGQTIADIFRAIESADFPASLRQDLTQTVRSSIKTALTSARPTK